LISSTPFTPSRFSQGLRNLTQNENQYR
jgi:hypothetical protein